MSLINDMLRDLADKQSIRQHDESMAIVDSASWEKERATSFFQQSRITVFFYSLLIFIVIFVSSKWLVTQYQSVQLTQNHVNEYKSEQQTTAGEQLISPVPVIDQQTDQQITQPIAQQQLSTTEVISNTVNPDNQQRIYQLIDLASRAMTLDRLTSPENDNAYFYYQELLSLDAQNPIAISGINKIGGRYLQMAETAMQKKDYLKAEFFLDKANLVTPNNSRIAEHRNAMDSRLRGNDSVAFIDSSPRDSDTSLSNENSSNDKNSGKQDLLITPNIEFLDQQTIKQAQDYIAQGAKTKALDLLQQHIQLYPAPISEQYLLDIYYQEKNLSAMQNLLNSNLHISVVDKTYYQARLAVLEGDNSTAIGLLESQLANAANNENYRALLAGLYQREQLYAQATTAYRNLLQNFTPKPAYWLGLALALDAQDQIPAATQSYRKVLDFEQIEPEVKEYTLGRIAQLSREN